MSGDIIKNASPDRQICDNFLSAKTKLVSFAMKFLIFACMQMCGGLGDRLQGATEAYYIALQTNRSFVVLPTVFRGVVREKEKYTIQPQCGRSEAHLRIIDRVDSSRLLKMAMSPHKCLYVSVNMMSGAAGANIREILASIFYPARYRPYEGRYTAVHIRTGGNGDFKGIDPPRYAADDVNRFLGRVEGSSRLFLATDSKEVKERARGFISTVVTLDELAVHIDRSAVIKDSDLGTVAKDFGALVNADCLVFGRSGFSEMALNFPGSRHNLSCSCKIPLDRLEPAVCGSGLASAWGVLYGKN